MIPHSKYRHHTRREHQYKNVLNAVKCTSNKMQRGRKKACLSFVWGEAYYSQNPETALHIESLIMDICTVIRNAISCPSRPLRRTCRMCSVASVHAQMRTHTSRALTSSGSFFAWVTSRHLPLNIIALNLTIMLCGTGTRSYFIHCHRERFTIFFLPIYICSYCCLAYFVDLIPRLTAFCIAPYWNIFIHAHAHNAIIIVLSRF